MKKKEAWPIVELGQVADVNPKSEKLLSPKSLVSFVPMAAVSEVTGSIASPVDRPFGDVSKGYTQFQDGDVIFARITPCMENGKAAVARGLTNGRGCGSTEFIVIRASGRILPEFIWHFLRRRAFRRDAEAAMTGAVGQRRVPPGFIRACKISLPPLNTQAAIVERLNAVVATSQASKVQLNRVLVLSRRYLATLRESVYDPESTSARLHGLDSEPWAYEPFFDVLDLHGGSQPPKSTFSEIAARGRVRLLQIRDFASDDKAVYIEDRPTWRKCESNDILVARYGASVGKILRGKSGAYNVALAKVVFKTDAVDRDFIYFWLHTAAFQDAVLGVSRSAQNGFNKDDLRHLRIPLPPLHIQQKVADVLKTAAERLRTIEAQVGASLRLLDAVESQVVKKAFFSNVKDDASDPRTTAQPEPSRRCADSRSAVAR